MAGTLTISTLSDGTNSTSSTNCIRGSAKAWVSIANPTTIQASYNVSSVTHPATGSYVINFTNALGSTPCGVAQSIGWWTTLNAVPTTTQGFVTTFQGGSFGNYDSSNVYAAFFSN